MIPVLSDLCQVEDPAYLRRLPKIIGQLFTAEIATLNLAPTVRFWPHEQQLLLLLFVLI